VGANRTTTLVACVTLAVYAGAATHAQVPPVSAEAAQPAPDQAASAAFARTLDEARAAALARGIAAATVDGALAGLAPDLEVLELAGRQSEHARSAADYLGRLVSEERIAAGRQHRALLAGSLDEIARRSGVETDILLAIWGIESSYGTAQGTRSVARSLATLAALEPRRSSFWRGELVAALAILARGDVAPARMTGSWAGAMGHTQFMPTTFLAHAVDHDGDGRADIWDNALDALASAANYLRVSGWVAGRGWGSEVVLPAAGFDHGLAAPGRALPLARWQELGVRPAAGTAFAANPGDLQLVLPAGAAGPAFLVTGNFRAILRYNAATLYALAVGHLADRIAGAGPLERPFPPDDRALSREEREEIQRRLVALGFDTGGIDGILGSQSRSAVRAFQRRRGLVEDGHPSAALLERLRAETMP
jgi:lytic murein transglycosylase